jgi:hypothetical protein
MSTIALFHNGIEETTSVGGLIDAIGASAHPMVAFSGFYKSHKPPLLGNAHGKVTLHRDGHQNGQKKWVHFASLFC